MGGWRKVVRSKSFAWGLLIWGLLGLASAATVAWTREQPILASGRVATETRTVRVGFEIPDTKATEAKRDEARQRAARVYVADAGVLDEIETSIANLPSVLADVDAIEKVDPGLRQQFGLTPEMLAAVRAQTDKPERMAAWFEQTRRLGERLRRTPLLDTQTYQVERTTINREMELRIPLPPGSTPSGGAGAGGGASGGGGSGWRTVLVESDKACSVGSDKHATEAKRIAAESGFLQRELFDVVVNRLLAITKPTYSYDQAASVASQEAAAAKVQVQMVPYPDRQVIFRRGDMLTDTNLEVLREAMRREEAAATPFARWAPRLGAAGVAMGIVAAMAGYTGLFLPRIRRNPMRLAVLAVLLFTTVATACLATASAPALMALTAIGPSVLVAVLLAIAYDQRTALAFGGLHAMMVCEALHLPAGWLAVIIAGVGAGVWHLRELRDRNTLIRLGVMTAAVLGVGAIIAGLAGLPASAESLRQIVRTDAGLAASAGLLVAMVTVFLLPVLERSFGITTGLTLIELRDPKQPLLRELQQRAPGTYNHSLNLASLAEAAAEAIGADGLLAYVGALYHDIGKMNKPDYFVENQTPGFNRHDKLSPAMSLLIIVGHVKDGMELAKEFGLPRALHHFIESHHGTTLVEYFYHRAKKKAEAEKSGTAGGGGGGASGAAGANVGSMTGGGGGAASLIAGQVQSQKEKEASPTVASPPTGLSDVAGAAGGAPTRAATGAGIVGGWGTMSTAAAAAAVAPISSVGGGTSSGGVVVVPGAGGSGNAGAGSGAGPSEIEYRYPGPKPRTKEAAIIMVCDAVESASRAMADPTPARIEALVRAVASRRLADGQFDECDLTLRELNIIVETTAKTLASIYHGRIAYPDGTTGKSETAKTDGAMGGAPGAGAAVDGARANGNGSGKESPQPKTAQVARAS